METENQAEIEERGHIKIDWGRQGGVILAYVTILLGYYGIIANTTMITFQPLGEIWISFLDMDRTILFWTYTTYLSNYFLPALLLFFVCFLLTYKEDIPHYGIKASIWIVPFLIAEGFVFYTIMFGVSMEPIILKFTHIEGYIDIIIILGLAVSGSICGMKLKQYRVMRKKI